MKKLGLSVLLVLSSCMAAMPSSGKLMMLKSGPVFMSSSASGSIISASATDGRTMNLPWMKNAERVDSAENTEQELAVALVKFRDKCARYAVVIFSSFGAAAEETGACDSEVRLSKSDTDILVVNDTDFSVYRISGTELLKVRGPASRAASPQTTAQPVKPHDTAIPKPGTATPDAKPPVTSPVKPATPVKQEGNSGTTPQAGVSGTVTPVAPATVPPSVPVRPSLSPVRRD